jgi:hypothetical protein
MKQNTVSWTALLLVVAMSGAFQVVEAFAQSNKARARSKQSPEATQRYGSEPTRIAQKDIVVSFQKNMYGGAISSLKKGSFEYVVNVHPLIPTRLERGVSLQAAFFYNSPLARGGTYRTYYNDCNNPLESGSLGDFTAAQGPRGVASPTTMQRPRFDTMLTRSQLALYLDPDTAVPHAKAKTASTGQKCDPKTSNTIRPGWPNSKLSNTYVGKKITIGDIGDEGAPIEIENVISVDYTLYTTEDYFHNNMVIAYAGLDGRKFKAMYTYDPRTQFLKSAPPKNRDTATPESKNNPSYGALPVIVTTRDGRRAFATYSPQIPLAGEGSNETYIGATGGYVRDVFPNGGVIDTQTYIREPKLKAGLNHYKIYYIVGTVDQVRKGLDRLHSFYKFLSPEFFNYKAFITAKRLDPNTSEAEARLHYICAKSGICKRAPI